MITCTRLGHQGNDSPNITNCMEILRENLDDKKKNEIKNKDTKEKSSTRQS